MSKDKYRPSITDKEVVTTHLEVAEPPISNGSSLAPTREELELGDGEGAIGPSKNAPTGLKVVSQRTYYSPEGQQFVEVVFEWDSLAGASEYLLRIA